MNKVFGPKLNGYNFQESGNQFMDNIIYFHDVVMCILFFILFLVTWFLFKTLLYFGNLEFTYALYVWQYHCKFRWFVLKNEFKLFGHYLKEPYAIYLEHVTKVAYAERLYGILLPLMEPHVYRLKNSIEYRYYFYSDVKLEFVWTLFPSIVLLLLAIPSFGLLFSVEKVSAPELTVKVIGHQWYWEYQYMDYIDVNEIVSTEDYIFVYKNKNEDNYIVESYMIADEDLSKGQYRLLEVDKKLVLPTDTSIRFLITSDDVLHSWSVPGLGIKVDACPGRLNEAIVNIRDIGLYYGQCSELCGWYHGFMPIVIQSLQRNDFRIWAIANFMDVKYLPQVEAEAIFNEPEELVKKVEKGVSLIKSNEFAIVHAFHGKLTALLAADEKDHDAIHLLINEYQVAMKIFDEYNAIK